MTPERNIRVQYAQELLQKLQSAQETLNQMSVQIEGGCDEAKSQTQDSNLTKMHEKRDRYIAQVESVKILHGQMTHAVGNWLSFLHTPENRKKILFPVHLLLLQKKTKAILHQCRADISAIGIRSRLLQDEIARLAYTIRADAIRHVQSGEQYTQYQAAQDEKDEVVKRLQYLLPTLPGMEQTVLNAADVTEVMHALQMLHA